MKIGILTLPFHGNLGGIFQNYALQRSLQKLGYDSQTIIIQNSKPARLSKVLSIAKRSFQKYILQKNIPVRVSPSKNEQNIILKELNRFIQEYIKVAPINSKQFENSKCLEGKYDAIIVGSDQVWRPKYTKDIQLYYLGFLPEKSKIKRIAYAASLGTNEWEYSVDQANACKQLVRKFHAVSVREMSAVSLLQEKFQLNAVQTLDPVLLLSQSDLEKLIPENQSNLAQSRAFINLLDNTDAAKYKTEKICQSRGLTPFSILPEKTFVQVGKEGIQDCIFPSIENWLKSFKYSSLVITDSFHGVVISILLNKDFICLGNEKRGLSRMTDILKKYKLMDRLVLDVDSLQDTKNLESIDYTEINKALDADRAQSFNFLKTALNS